jgi:uncharacterized protein (TIRG00374 family)
MYHSVRSILRRMLPGVLLGFLVLLAVSFIGDLRQVAETVRNFDWRVYPLALLLTLVNYMLRFYKWHFYLGQIGVKGIEWQESLRLFVGGFPLAVTPGKVGEALKAVWLNQHSGVSVERGVSVVVAERLSDGLAVLLLSVLGVISYPQYWTVFVTILVFGLSFIVVSQFRSLAMWFLGIGEKIPGISKFVHNLREFYEGSSVLFKPLPTLIAVGLGTISWLWEGIGFYLILLGLGLRPGIQLAASAIFILAFSTIIGAVSALPGGLGAAEASIAGMLALVVGLNAALSAAATLLIRLATLWFGVGLGLVVWFKYPYLLGLGGGHVAETKG